MITNNRSELAISPMIDVTTVRMGSREFMERHTWGYRHEQEYYMGDFLFLYEMLLVILMANVRNDERAF